jgi:MSHA biogenesis protein MshI
LFNFLRRKQQSTKRTAVVCTSDGWAAASIRRPHGGRPQVESCVSFECVESEQQSAIAAWLAGARHQLGAVGGLLDAADYQLLLVESPDVLPAELKAAVRWRLKDAIDFPIDDAVVDVFDIPEQARHTGSKMMYAIAANRPAIDAQVALLKPAGRQFDVIDIPEMALRNLASVLPEAADGVIVLWLNDDAAQLLVIKQATLYLTRHVQFSQRVSMDATGVLTSPGAAPDVEAIALELQRSMDYFESHYEQAAISHLVIAPCDERAEQLSNALAGETSMRIHLIDVAQALDLPEGMEVMDRRSLLAIGAALREDRKAL